MGEVGDSEHQDATFQRWQGSQRTRQRSEQPLLSERQMLFTERLEDDTVLWKKVLNTINRKGRLGDF